MMDVVAIGELLIDFTSKKLDADGYPTMERTLAVHRQIFLLR